MLFSKMKLKDFSRCLFVLCENSDKMCQEMSDSRKDARAHRNAWKLMILATGSVTPEGIKPIRMGKRGKERKV
jgi:hypothetical protein